MYRSSFRHISQFAPLRVCSQTSTRRPYNLFCAATLDKYKNSHDSSSHQLHVGHFCGQSRNISTSCFLSSDSGDIQTITCPAFAESISEGDIRWDKAVGDSVQRDEAVCEVETDKTSVPVPSPIDGVVVELLVEDGSTVTPGMKLANIKAGGGGATTESSAPKSAEPEQQREAPTPSPPVEEAKSSPVEPTPALKEQIPTSAVKKAPPSPPKQQISSSSANPTVRMPPRDPTKAIHGTRSESRVKMNRMRLKIAQRLKDAQNTTAMLTTFNEIDMSSLMELRKVNQESFMKKHGLKLGFMSAFLKASAHALVQKPTVNAYIDGDEIVYRDFVDISVAVATPKGLVVPVLRSCQDMNYADFEKGIAALGQKAKEGQLSVEDMAGGTFTISNGGVFGSLFGTPIINPPQSAILGMHGVFDRPVVRDGQIVIRPMMYIALTYDHRLIDGREAVTFLRTIKAGVEDPRTMLL